MHSLRLKILLVVAMPIVLVILLLPLGKAFAATCSAADETCLRAHSVPIGTACPEKEARCIESAINNRSACSTEGGEEEFNLCVNRIKELIENPVNDVGDNGLGWLGNQVYAAIMYVVNFFLALIIGLFGWALTAIATGFDTVLQFTVVNFGETYGKYFADGVDAGWQGFRDIANIVMIAMFVYVAFNVILDIETYGLKKFGIRILMIALLINFSLFFTKAIIDISNVTAGQFAKSIKTDRDDGSKLAIGEAVIIKSGIGKTTFDASYETLENISEQTGMGPFIYTFATVIFFIIMIAIFLHGFILLITRMVVLVLLMVTSALAFTAFLIPKYGDTWWNKWWEALIKNALFAPILMLMLWASLNIMDAMYAGAGEDAAFEGFEALITNPTVSMWTPIFFILIVSGLFYGSIKVASELSMAGAGFAKSVGMKGLGFGLRAGGVGALLSGGLKLRNAGARRLGNGLSRAGFAGLGAQLNTMSEKKHISDTAAGKASSKRLGLSFGADQSKAIADHMAGIEKAKAEEEMKTKQTQQLKSLEKGEQNATKIRDKARKEKEAALGSNVTKAFRDDLSKAMAQRDEVEANLETKVARQAPLKSQLGEMQQDFNDNEGSMGETEKQQKLQRINELSTTIGAMDTSIDELKMALRNKSAEVTDSEKIVRGHEGRISKPFDEKIAKADKLLTKIQSKTEKTKKSNYIKEGAKEIAKENIDRRFVLGLDGGASVKEMAKKKVGESDADRISAAIAKASKKDDSPAPEPKKKES